MYSFLSAIISPVCGLTTFLLVNLPKILSYKDSITVPAFSSLISSTTTPWVVPQSSSLTITSCATSTNLLVK